MLVASNFHQADVIFKVIDLLLSKSMPLRLAKKSTVSESLLQLKLWLQ